MYCIYPGDTNRRYEWLEAINRMDLLEKLEDNRSRSNHRICEYHFQDNYVKKSNGPNKTRKCLTKDAVPSLLPVNKALLNLSELEKSEQNLTVQKILDSDKIKCVTRMKKSKPKKNKPKMNNTDLDNDDRETGTLSMIAEVQVTIEPITEDIIAADKIKTEKIDIEGGENPHCPQFASPELSTFSDLSQYCESVMKVSKETQTPPQATEDSLKRAKKRKLDQTETNEYFLQSCSKNLPKGMLQLVKWQTNSKQNNLDNYKFHMFALNLYFSGANAYSWLKGMMGLPDIGVIKKLFIPKNTKFDNSLINVFKIKVDNMSQSERICSVSISTMLLNPKLYYNIKADKVEGFHEIDGVQKMEPAKYALVFMVQGIVEKWTQPVAHAFISRHENSPDISIWVEETITLLIDIGLDVRAFVSDPKTELLYMSESQRVTPAKPYFYINDKIIYYIYDTTQLQNSVKGYMKNCNFLAAGISESCDNAEFTVKFSNLISILNSKTRMSMSPFKKAYSDKKSQNSFLKEMLALFSNLKVVRRADGLEIKNMRFIDCIQISIMSIMNLFKGLKNVGAKSLLTSRLSQYSLNKFFEKAKSRSKKGCSSRQFRSCFARCFVYNMLKKPRGDCRGKNAVVQEGFRAQSLLSVGKSANQLISVGTTDYRLALPEKKRIDTVCRYLYLKCIDYHSCDKFKEYLSQSPESRLYVAPYRSSAPLDIRNCKLTPPRNFISFIMILEKRFRDYCKQDIKISSIGHQILKKIASFEFEMPCKCFPLDYVKKLFVRLRIYFTVRENNVVYKKDNNKLFNTFKI
ncbi:hypothetical protein MSG28_003168 [Choristoneura fumiferana]|uniref:Uncharacterized protein n=1 Tax=Choristoneura fumiferana TaxID=7141 RepID=A0ACC0KE93_CHOFU|nr:hypothetical protein MSG28_003168 [Choristoneura fumiferana]